MIITNFGGVINIVSWIGESMNSKLDEYNRGIFKYNTDNVILSMEKINLEVEYGETYEGVLEISTENNTFLKGVAYSSHEFVKIENNSFAGIKNELKYKVVNCTEGQQEIKGNITIVTNCNEVVVPFNITLRHPKFDSSIGEIRDLFQFTNLAKSEPDEALEIFLSPRFERVLINKDIKTELIYRSLVKSNNKHIALEEFLVAIRKKTPIVVEINKDHFEFELHGEAIKDKITLKKKDWGYCEYEVSSTAKFISFDKYLIHNEDFVANKCKLEFYLNPELMKTGKNQAQIIIKSNTDKQVINVVCNNEKRYVKTEKIKLKEYRYKFIKNYLDFRMGNINLDKYLSENEEITNNLCSYEQDGVNQLLRVYLYIGSGKKERAKQLLEDFEEKFNDSDEVEALSRCGYMYLKTLINDDPDYIKIAIKTITNYYENVDNDWQILWMLLYLDKKYDSNYMNKVKAIKEQFKKGCTSPIMYYEVCTVFNKDYSMLRNLGDFEIQILNWATKRGCVSRELAIAYATLATRLKDFNSLVYKSLAVLYGKYEQKEILTAICTMLIKAQMCGPMYFKWYKLGVQEQLKITQLYESYMYSYDESSNEPLLEPLLLYFSYNSNLADNKKAFLYAFVIKNKENNPHMYETYLPQIREFAMRQLKQHVINENLKVIYEEIITKDIVDENIAKDLPYVMFKYDISCYRPEYVGAVVVHKALVIEQYVQFNNGKAQINVFTESAEIFLVDKDGNRYVRNNFYTLKKLFNASALIDKCFEYNQTDGMLILYLQDRVDNYYREDVEGKVIEKEVIRVPHLSSEYKKKYLYDLIQYTYENNELDLLDKYLEMIDIDGMSPKQRSYVIEYMILRGFKEKALDAILTYGYSNIPVNRLERLASATIELEEYKDIVLGICSYVFEKGKATETILNYLSDKYQGSTRKMYKLWKACKQYDSIDTAILEENIIAQMLFAESYVPNSFAIFKSYYKHYTSKKVVKAYLMYNSYKYLVKDRVLDDDFFTILYGELNTSGNDLMAMALLKYYSTKDYLTDNEKMFVNKSIEYFVKQKKILPFFKAFAKFTTLPEYIADKYYVQYITDPESKVTIHYSLDENGEDELKFSSENMEDVFYGIRVKEFILFYEDNLQYYIVEANDEDISVTESNNILVDECDTDDETRYNRINLMLMSRNMNEERTLIDSMKTLVVTDYLAEEMFKIL